MKFNSWNTFFFSELTTFNSDFECSSHSNFDGSIISHYKLYPVLMQQWNSNELWINFFPPYVLKLFLSLKSLRLSNISLIHIFGSIESKIQLTMYGEYQPNLFIGISVVNLLSTSFATCRSWNYLFSTYAFQNSWSHVIEMQFKVFQHSRIYWLT